MSPITVLDGPAGIGKRSAVSCQSPVAVHSCFCFVFLRCLFDTFLPVAVCSATLNYIVQYARSNGWLCMFIPNVFRIMRDGMVVTPSRREAGMFDQHDLAMEALKHMLAVHGDDLARLPQKGTYTNDRYLTPDLDAVAVEQREKRYAEENERRRRARAEAEAEGRTWDADAAAAGALPVEETATDIDRSALTLKDMLEWAVAHPPAATDTLLDFRQELANVTDMPVMLAVDGVQAAYQPTESYPWDGE